MECMAVNDISYGREAEIWPRDYSMLARRVQFLRFNDIPVRLVSNNARIITGYIAKFNPSENLILASDKPKGNKRIEVKLESLVILEELSGNDAFNLSLVPTDEFNLQQYTPSRRDYFSICNKCYKQGVGIKIYMKYGQVLTGKTTGVNACQVGVRKSNGNHMQVMFDWVSRITSSDYAE
ncbi:phase 1 flagellin gene repressor FljA [Salmonella enterica]|nr:phase 1 flagellin gene repressor FljA [Salmonella enterica]EGP6248409.1 phase 1 flagellin gene repressor FljA [Salmonella enterica]EHA7576016.1 phase 1 flagellin gene repressor FljA [Salmonella enterica]EHA7831212.1 phase 1 flagellin gene repressor FljA [Salmonella enterica]EJL1060320.1 phase 1 flagellin gene repressor FljA [Salmonella enterica]